MHDSQSEVVIECVITAIVMIFFSKQNARAKDKPRRSSSYSRPFCKQNIDSKTRKVNSIVGMTKIYWW